MKNVLFRFHKNFLTFYLMISLIVLCSCNNGIKRFHALDKDVVDTFNILSYTSSEEVFFDLILVVDNSSTMKDNQKKLAKNFQHFINEFDSQESDFQIGVITTDHYKYHQGLHAGPSNTAILTQDTPNLKKLFMENAMVGTDGWKNEMGMKSLIDFLEGKGSTFLRTDVHLKVIIISDEEDQDTLDENEYVFHYMDKLKQVKGDDDFSISAIVQTEKCLRTGYSIKYKKLAWKASGDTYSICKNFSTIARDLAHSIKNQATSFRLSKTSDPLTIQVFVDGELKIQDQDWNYDKEANRIFFTFDSVPEVGDEVKIHYQHLEF